MGTAAALEGSTAHWNAIALRLRESTALARMLNQGPAFKGEHYVSKALVCIILDALGQSAAPRATKPDGFFTFCIAIVSEAQSKAT